ncbi:MAG TPA: MmgE/PrpD family protein [Bordetella sp.]|nr:MmgE/PrpD family protein [Bordetella sp.]
MQEHLQALSTFVCQHPSASLDSAALHRAKWVILDSLTAIAAGMQVDEMRSFSNATLADALPGPCWVVGTGKRTNASDAALLNGMAGTWLELNEGNLIAKGHPGIQVVPIAIAMAQQLRSTGRDLLRAVVMGYEVASRVGRGARLRLAVHPHGTYGAIGAAVAVGVLKGYNASAIQQLISVAATLGLATSRRTLLEGATVRNVYTGHSGVMGLWASRLIEAGFTGEPTGVQSAFGQVLGDAFDETSLSQGLGQEWLINRGYFKLHCTGRYVHAAIDALEDACAGLPSARITAEDIEWIDVRTFALAAMLNGQNIDSSFGARFSIPFALATLIVHGESSLEAFSDPAVRNTEVQSLCQRIHVQEIPGFTQRYPAEQVCEVDILTRRGETLRGRCELMKGEAGNPYKNGEVEAKYLKLATEAWGTDTATRLRVGILALEQVEDFEQLTRSLPL